jgi:hypothetical protein
MISPKSRGRCPQHSGAPPRAAFTRARRCAGALPVKGYVTPGRGVVGTPTNRGGRCPARGMRPGHGRAGRRQRCRGTARGSASTRGPRHEPAAPHHWRRPAQPCRQVLPDPGGRLRPHDGWCGSGWPTTGRAPSWSELWSALSRGTARHLSRDGAKIVCQLATPSPSSSACSATAAAAAADPLLRLERFRRPSA